MTNIKNFIFQGGNKMKKKLLALGMATCLALSGTTMAFGADQTAEIQQQSEVQVLLKVM